MLDYKNNAWHARLYRSSYSTENLPNNLCPYFWLVVIAIVGFPMFLPSHVVNLFIKKKRILMTSVSMVTFTVLTNGILMHHWLFTGSYCVVCAFMFIWYAITLRRIKKGTWKPPVTLVKPNIFRDWWSAFKGKYCPRITWFDNHNEIVLSPLQKRLKELAELDEPGWAKEIQAFRDKIDKDNHVDYN